MIDKTPFLCYNIIRKRKENNYGKYYKISEDELIELLATYIKMIALLKDGVDNWAWYGAGFNDMIKEYFPEATEEEIKDLNFSDCAETLLTDYEEVKD